jgi:hypothetical protein
MSTTSVIRGGGLSLKYVRKNRRVSSGYKDRLGQQICVFLISNKFNQTWNHWFSRKSKDQLKISSALRPGLPVLLPVPSGENLCFFEIVVQRNPGTFVVSFLS